MKKRIIYILILIVFITLVVAGIIWANNSKNKEKKIDAHTTVSNTNVITDISKIEENIETEPRENEEEKEKSNVDIVIGDNYFVTQINDIYLNFEDYEGKTIEIEGFPLDNGYTFVGRYGPRMLCK